MTRFRPERISLTEWYEALPDRRDENEQFDAERSLAGLHRWIDRQENEMTHAEALVLAAGAEPELDRTLLDGAQLYLSFGPAPLSELVRVLAQHLETSQHQAVRAGIVRLAAAGTLNLAGAIVSLPAGTDTRDTQEN